MNATLTPSCLRAPSDLLIPAMECCILNAREKLNAVALAACVLVALVAGSLCGSWFFALVIVVALFGVALSGGAIRTGGHRGRRR